MNNEVSNLDHADDDILIHEISDDALESAGDPGAGRPCFSFAGGDCTTIPACFPLKAHDRRRTQRRGGAGRRPFAAPNISIAAQQRRNPGDCPGDAPGVVLAETLQYAPADRLVLEIEVGELLPRAIDHDVALDALLDGPGRRKSAGIGHGPIRT
jgi:hypothetical protein